MDAGPPAPGPALYGANSSGALYFIDLELRSVTRIGDLTVGTNAIASRADDGLVYYFDRDETTPRLFTYDPRTGDDRALGATDLTQGIAARAGFDSSGRLWAMNSQFVPDDGPNEVFVLDPDGPTFPANATLVADLEPPVRLGGDLAFGASLDALFLIDRSSVLHRVDATAMPPMLVESLAITGGPGGDPFTGIARSSDGRVFLSDDTSGAPALHELDVTTGAVTRYLDLPAELNDLCPAHARPPGL